MGVGHRARRFAPQRNSRGRVGGTRTETRRRHQPDFASDLSGGLRRGRSIRRCHRNSGAWIRICTARREPRIGRRICCRPRPISTASTLPRRKSRTARRLIRKTGLRPVEISVAAVCDHRTGQRPVFRSLPPPPPNYLATSADSLMFRHTI